MAVLFSVDSSAQEFTWDQNSTIAGPQNGLGTWNTTSTNWWDFVAGSNTAWINSTSSIANIGVVGGTVLNQSVITVASDLQLKELNFRSVATGTPVSGHQYSMNGDVAGRIIDFGLNGLIQVEDFASGGSQFITLGANLRLKGENLRVQKYGPGTAFQFMNLSMAANPELTGTLTLGGSIYAGFNPNNMPAVSTFVVEAGGSAAIGTGNQIFTVPFHLAGYGNGLTNTSTAYGAIRMTGNNNNYAGGILLTANAGVNTSSSGGTNGTGILISSPITDGGNNFEFSRFAFGGEGTLTLAAANTYGGATVLGRQVSNYSGSVTILDFSASTSPTSDILYNGLSQPGNLQLFGGPSPSVLRLVGGEGQVNSQRLGNVSVAGTHTALELVPSAEGSVNVTTGMLSRENNLVTFNIINRGAGSVTTSGMDEGFVGPWMSYSGPFGLRSWGMIQENGQVAGGYAGDVSLIEGGELTNGAYATTANLNLSNASFGPVSAGVGTTFLNTLSMSDGSNDRQLPLVTGQTVRLGATGGVQVLSGGRSLTIGEAGSGGILSAGGPTLNTAGTLFLSNHSTSSLLTVGANITNNGSGAVAVVVNGAPGAKTILTGTNTYTGGTRVTGGTLEVRSNGALGTTGTITVVEGTVASLALGGGVTLNRVVSIGGTGDGNLGALRSVDGNNTLTGSVTIVGHSLISADAGAVLTLSGASAATNVVTGSFILSLGGAGTINVNGRLNLTSGSLVKVGNGVLNLGGQHIYTGATTVSGGTLQLMPGLTSTTSALSMGVGTSLSLNGVNWDRPLTLNGNGFLGLGALYNDSATGATLSGTVALAGVAKIGGTGDITISNAGGLTGSVAMTKVGGGALTVVSAAGSARTGVNFLNEGLLRLQGATAFAPIGTGAMGMNGGTLSLGFDAAGTVGGAVNMISDSTIITDRATLGAGGYSLTLGVLVIGEHTLTVRAGSNVESGTMGLTLGSVTLGGPSTIPGNPTFDVQGAAAATTVLTMGAIADQSMAPRTITFQNSGGAPSAVNLAAAATSLVNGTLINLAAAGAPVTVNLNAATVLGTLAQVTVGAGNTLNLGAAQTLGSLAGTGTVTSSAAFTLTVGNATSFALHNTNFSGVLSNGNGTLALTKLGKNTLTLDGAVSNTYTGATTVAAGTLVLAKTDGATAVGGNLTVGNSAASTAGLATVRLEGPNQMLTTASVAVNAGATLDLNGYDLPVGLLTTLAGGTILGTGNTITASASGGTFTSNGVSHLYANYQMTGTVAATRTISVTNSTDILTIHGKVTQGAFNGAITKTGTGTLALSGDNDYTGVTTISTGMINIRSANALGAVAAGTSVAAGASLQIQGDITTAAEPLTLNGTGFAGVGGVGMQNGALVNVSGVNNYAGLITLASAATISSDGGRLSLTHPGTITGAGFGLTLSGAGDGRVGSNIGTTTGAVFKTGVGTWVLAGSNTNTGTTTVSHGTLQLGDGITGSWTSTPGLTFAGTGRFNYQGITTGSSQGLGALGFAAGDGTVQSSYGGESGETSLTFASLAARSVGGTGNFVIEGGVNGITNKIVLTGQPLDSFLDQGLFFGGSTYAWYDADGFVRGLDYLTDTGAVTSGAGLSLGSAEFQQITGAITAQESAMFTTFHIDGNHDLTLADAQTMTVNGLLKTGAAMGGSVISGGAGIRAGLNAEMVIRVDEAGDTLTLTTPVLANGSNGLTKSGAGTLLLNPTNSYTGPTHVAAGTLILGGGGTLTTSLIAVSTGGALDLNGQVISNGVSINGSGPAGVGSLVNNGVGVAQVGGITLLSNATIGGAGDMISTGVLVGLSPIRLFKVGAGTATFGDNAGVALASARTGVNQIDEGVLRISNSPSAIGTAAAQLVLNGGKVSLGSATSVVAYPTAVTANSGIETDVYVAGAGLVHTLGTLAIGSQMLTITAGSNVTEVGTNAGVTFGITTLRGNPIFDVQSPTTAVSGTTTLTLGALNDQGNAKTITFTNSGASSTNAVVTLSAAAGSLMQGTVVTIGGGVNAGVTLNLNAANALGTLSQVSFDEKSVLNLGAAQTVGSLIGSGTVSASGVFALTVGNANSPVAIDSEFIASLTNGAGTLAFTKAGLGTMTFSPAESTYTGVTTVSGGILKLGHSNALGLSSGLTVGVESTVDLNGQNSDRNFNIRGVGFGGMGAMVNSSEITSTLTGAMVLGSFTKVGGSGNITINNLGGVTGNNPLTKVGTGTLTFISEVTSARTGVNQLDEGVLRLEAATGIRPVGNGVIALNGGTLSLGFDGEGSVGGAVNLLSDSTIIADRMTEGGENLVLSLGALIIGGNTLTIKAGSNVTSGTIGLTLGTTTIGGPALAPGNPVFDVQSSLTAVTHLRLGALSDQAIDARTITFQNSGVGDSLVTLAANATSLVNGTVVNLANTGGSVRLNLDIAGALGQFAQVTVANGNTLALGASPTFGGLNGAGRVTASVPAVLTVGNALSSLPVDSVFNGVIEGAADLSLVKAGVGTLTMGGAESNTFAGAGGLLVSGGTLILAKTAGAIAVPTQLTMGAVGGFAPVLVQLAGDHQIATTAKVVMNAGSTLDVNGFSQSFGSLTGLAGSSIINNATGTEQTLTFGVANSTGNVFAGSILDNTVGTGTLAVSKVGTGELTLLGANRFSGAVSVTGGTLSFMDESNLGNGSVGNVINLSGSTLKYMGSGTANLGINQRLTIGSDGATVNVTDAGGALVFGGEVNALSTGNLIKTGPGLLSLPGTTNLNGAGLTVSDGVLKAGFGLEGIGTLTVGPTGVLDLSNGSAQALSGLTGLTLNGGSRLGFELDSFSNDSLASLVAASVAGTIMLDFFSVGDGVTARTYELISAPGGLLGASYAVGQGINGWNFAINSTDTLVSVVATKLQLLYWRGGQDGSWSTLGAGVANWTTDSEGLVDASQTPGFADTVVFSAAAAPLGLGSEIVTELNAAFLVDGLIFEGSPVAVNEVTINPGIGGELTLKPLSSTGGVEVRDNAGTVTIAVPMIVGGSQSWKVASTGTSLAIVGPVSFDHEVTKLGGGPLTLSGGNSGSGGVRLGQGRLNLNSETALGLGTFTVDGGTTVDNTSAGPITLMTNNAQVWNGSFSYEGTQALNLGVGDIMLAQNVMINTVANVLTVGGVIADGAGVHGLGKTGAGTLVIAGSNTYRGATILTQGTLVFAADQYLPGEDNSLILGATAGSAGSFSLNLSGASAVFGGDALVQTENLVPNAIVIGSGKSLTLLGGFSMGYQSMGESNTRLAVSGEGVLRLGDVNSPTLKDVWIGNGDTAGVMNSSVLDLSGLASFYANLGDGATFGIGDSAVGGTLPIAANGGSSVILATESTLIAESVLIGGTTLATHSLKLGMGSSIVYANTLSISGMSSSGHATLGFLGSTGQFVLRDLAGAGRAQMNVQNGSSVSAGSLSGTADFTGHFADLLIDTLAIGGRSAATTGDGAGYFYFDRGILDATTIQLATRTGASQTTGAVTGVLSLGGGGSDSVVTIGTLNMSTNHSSGMASSGDAVSTVNLSGGGTIDIGALNMGSLTMSGAAATSGVLATVNTNANLVTIGSITMAVNDSSDAVLEETVAASTLSITAGTVNVVGGINMGGTAANALNKVDNLIQVSGSGRLVVGGGITAINGLGTELVRLKLDGGVLDMMGGSIGSVLAPITVMAESGTLRNLGQVNGGAGFTKTTAGTVVLEGNNFFDGLTVAAGLMQFSSAASLAEGITTLETDVVTVVGGGTLGGIGEIMGDLVLSGSPDALAILRPGIDAVTSGKELLAVNGALTIGEYSEVAFFLGQANFTALEVETIQFIDTTVRFSFSLESNYVPAAGSSFHVLSWTNGGFSLAHDWTTNLDLPGDGTILWDTSDFISMGVLRVQGLQQAPVVTSPPQSMTVNAGEATLLSVGILGSEVWLIQWLKDDVAIPGATGLTYTISETSPEAAGIYKVVVKNDYGEVISEGGTLTVRTIPTFASQPQGAVLVGGTALSLQVAVLGPPVLNYVWKKDGVAVVGAPNAPNYSISVVNKAVHEGLYTVEVSNSFGTVESEPAVVVINNSPLIVTQPVAKSVPEGNIATFTVVATGDGVLTYQWRRNGVALTDGGDYAGTTSPTLQVRATTMTAVSSQYSVVISGIGAPATSVAVALSFAPVTVVVEQNPLAQIVPVGGAVSLSVATRGGLPQKFQWFRNGTRVAGATSDTLVIPSATLRSAGAYTCVISNDLMTGKSSATTLAAEVAVVDTTPRRIVIREGSASPTLSVNAAGAGIEYAWYENVGSSSVPNLQLISGQNQRAFNPGALAAGRRTYVCRVAAVGGNLDAGNNDIWIYDGAPSIVESGWGLPNTTVSAPYSFQVPLSGQSIDAELGGFGDFEPDKAPVSFTASGLPAGLRINGQGLISGRATVDGTFNVTITAINAVGRSVFGPTPLVVAGLSENVIGEFTGPMDRHSILNGNLGGAVSLRTNKKGTYTGKVTMGARTFAFKGLLNPTGGEAVGEAVISRGKALSPLTLTFALDAATGLINRAVSGISDGVNTVGFDGWRFSWKAVRGAPPPAAALAGYYTLGLNLAEDLIGTSEFEGVPQGSGYAGFTVNAKTGRLVVAGRVADGTAFTTATFAGPGGEVMLFRTLYATNARGSVVGQFKIDGGANAVIADDNTLEGTVSWLRPTTVATKGQIYRAGFGPLELEAVGSRYLAPLASSTSPRVMGLDATADGVGNAIIELTEANVEGALPPMTAAEANTAVFRVDEKNRAVATDAGNNQRAVTLRINAKTGAFTGQFVLNEAHPFPGQRPDPIIRRVTYQGLIVTGGAEPIGVGYFLLPKLPSSEQEKVTATPILSGRVVFGKP